MTMQATYLAYVLQGLACLGSSARSTGRKARLLPGHGLRYDVPGNMLALFCMSQYMSLHAWAHQRAVLLC